MDDRAFEICIEQIKSGNQDGLKEIYEAYLPYIYSVILSVLGNKEDAEDVSCEFFIKLWNTAEKYRPGGGHKTYITTIARNMAIDYLRKRKRETPADLSGGSEMTENAAYHESPDEKVSSLYEPADTGFEDRLVDSMTLKDALSTLDAKEREIINLKIMSGFTFKEIAQILEMPMGTVTWKYNEALKKLRKFGYE